MARELEASGRHHRARKLLGEHGSELHTHEMHIRRAHNRGFIARHDMRDPDGRPPDDGQASEREYVLANKAAMLAHVGQHMDDGPPPPDDGDGPPPPPPPGGPGPDDAGQD